MGSWEWGVKTQNSKLKTQNSKLKTQNYPSLLTPHPSLEHNLCHISLESLYSRKREGKTE